MSRIEVDKSYLEQLEYNYKKRGQKIEQLKNEIENLIKANAHSEFIIRTELEPRIKQEKQNYDSWVTQDTGERESEYFCNTIDKLCNYVTNKDYERYFEWEEMDKDLYAMILYLYPEDIKDIETNNIVFIPCHCMDCGRLWKRFEV